jgi:hypothetical protein
MPEQSCRAIATGGKSLPPLKPCGTCHAVAGSGVLSYAVYFILCILAGLAGLALLDVPFWA